MLYCLFAAFVPPCLAYVWWLMLSKVIVYPIDFPAAPGAQGPQAPEDDFAVGTDELRVLSLEDPSLQEAELAAVARVVTQGVGVDSAKKN